MSDQESLDIILLLTLGFVLLKVTSVIHWPWLFVITPVWGVFGVAALQEVADLIFGGLNG